VVEGTSLENMLSLLGNHHPKYELCLFKKQKQLYRKQLKQLKPPTRDVQNTLF